MSSGLQMTRRIRRTPYTHVLEKLGVRGFTVVNHMLLPKAFQTSVEEDYWHLREHVQLWDVSTQRQVELKGKDAAKLAQWMTPRNISDAKTGQCLYVPLVEEGGGLINDPVLLKLSDNHFWFSIADSDVLLWAKGLAAGMSLDVVIKEPDVSPLAVQGPKAEALMAKVFGEQVRDIGFFKFAWFEFKGTQQLIARSGYSKQGGFEIYLDGGYLGEALWNTLWEAGQEFNVRPGCPNLIERIEGGLLSYGNEFNLENNPLECGLSEYCSFDEEIEYLGKAALMKIKSKGVSRLMRGVMFDGGPCPTCSVPWPVLVGEKQVGEITSAIWSPRLKMNVGLSLVDIEACGHGHSVSVLSSDGARRNGSVTKLPFD